MKHVFHYWENIPYEAKDRGIKLWFKRTLVRLNVALSDGAICGMHKAEEILRPYAPKLHIETFLHAGLDENKFRSGLDPVLRRRFGWDGKIIFLYVGALGYRKGIHHAIRALASLSKVSDDVAMLIVGSGEYLAELRRLTDDLDMAERIRFVPWMDNSQLPAVYNSADVVLYPSFSYRGWEEQFGYVIAEASLCERPVISTRSGSIDEVLVDGKTGIMVRPDDETALAEAMERLAKNPSLREEMGREGRLFIAEHFSNRIIAQRLYSFFHAI
jgi:glycosyltransferase involved in cell wall biosynthesis